MTDDYVDQATTLKSSDAPDGERLDGSERHQDHYQRLAVANSLDWNGKWRDERRATRKDASAIIDAVASTLELTEYQTNKAHRYFDHLPDDYNQAYSTSLLALCVTGMAGRDDGRDYHPNNVHPESETDGAFVEFARDDLGASYEQLYSCWNRIRGELP